MVIKPTIQQALRRASRNPLTEEMNFLELPVNQLVAYRLFELANTFPTGRRDPRNAARELLFNYMQGKRRAGTSPVVPSKERGLEFLDLTVKEIDV